jgi:hypothetical protein
MAEYEQYASEWEVVSTLRTMCTDGTVAARVAQAVEQRDAANREAGQRWAEQLAAQARAADGAAPRKKGKAGRKGGRLAGGTTARHTRNGDLS